MRIQSSQTNHTQKVHNHPNHTNKSFKQHMQTIIHTINQNRTHWTTKHATHNTNNNTSLKNIQATSFFLNKECHAQTLKKYTEHAKTHSTTNANKIKITIIQAKSNSRSTHVAKTIQHLSNSHANNKTCKIKWKKGTNQSSHTESTVWFIAKEQSYTHISNSCKVKHKTLHTHSKSYNIKATSSKTNKQNDSTHYIQSHPKHSQISFNNHAILIQQKHSAVQQIMQSLRTKKSYAISFTIIR